MEAMACTSEPLTRIEYVRQYGITIGDKSNTPPQNTRNSKTLKTPPSRLLSPPRSTVNGHEWTHHGPQKRPQILKEFWGRLRGVDSQLSNR
jgi:hypothetical protein